MILKTIKSRILAIREELKDEENAVKAKDNWYIANHTYEDEVNFYEKVPSQIASSDDVDDKLYSVALVKYNRALFSSLDWKPDQIQILG